MKNFRVLVLVLFSSLTVSLYAAPTITSISPTSGAVGGSVSIAGTGFGATQGTSTISLNSANVSVMSWSDSTIIAVVPAGASSGTFSVTVGGQAANSPTFTVSALPSGWSQADIGSTGVSGSGTYANGTFTVQGAGQQIWGTADAFHFAYQPWSGDGTIVARVVSMNGSAAYRSAGVMIRETLDAGSTNAKTSSWPYYGQICFDLRATTGGNSSEPGCPSLSLPYWVKVVRSGNTFTSFQGPDGVTWTQIGSGQTINMAQNIYVGLAVTSGSTSATATATFDNVSVSSTSSPAPVITSLSPASGLPGSQVTISGSGFGASQGGSVVTLNGIPVTINSWSSSAIVITIPAGAATGPMQVSVAPTLNASNSIVFTVLSSPLSGWIDQDIGAVGVTGSASFANGIFTVKGAGYQINSTADAFHFVYQPLSGDGTIVARVVSAQGSGSNGLAGVMVRETLDPAATFAIAADSPFNNNTFYFRLRSTAGGSATSITSASGTLPYWVKVERIGNAFTTFTAPDGVNWTQLGSSQIINMATNVYIGLAVNSGSNSALATVTFDSVLVDSAAAPAPIIASVSATTGSVGSRVTINGLNFGSSQGSSLVTLNDVPVTINSWSNSTIVITIPAGATSGPLVVSVGPSLNNSNDVIFTVTSNPLPGGWLDEDVGIPGMSGTGTYANGTFTVQGAGSQIYGTADGFHYVYQPFSGDGTIVARVVSMQGNSSNGEAGVMIRETLNTAATNATTAMWPWINTLYFDFRNTPGGSQTHAGSGSATLPYWVKVVRSGNTFTGYGSPDGATWTQLGSSQTINMAQNVFAGLAVNSGSNSALATATFDNVSVSSAAAGAPVITSLSATTGPIGSQVTINGLNFGASQGGSVVTLNNGAVTINSWRDRAIVITIPAGAVSGPLLVSVAPSMNDSNYVVFTVTSNPLPSGWLDRDIGAPGVNGSGTYSNGTFTVQGAGYQINGMADAFHYVYQPLSGDGTLVVRVASVQGSLSTGLAGVMIRETLDTAATNATTAASSYNSTIYFDVRSMPGGSTTGSGGLLASLPYWVKVVRAGNSFTGYRSPDGVSWTQIGSSQTINMAQSVYVGLAVNSGSTSAVATATFDNLSLVALAVPNVETVSPSPVAAGSAVTITGASFGATQGSSTVTFNGTAPSSVSSWSSSQIVATIASTAPAGTGPVSVVVHSVPSNTTVSLEVINPVISTMAPRSGAPGGTVVISGSGFGAGQGGGQVNFNNVSASVISWSDTSISATIPSNAVSGPVTVANLGLTSNGVQFTLEGQPTITGLSPSSGQNGTQVTITGSGFGAIQSSSTVLFNGIPPTVNSWSDTQIVGTIAPGTSTGPVTVTVASLTAQTTAFTVNSVVQVTDSLGNASSYTSASAGSTWNNIAATGSGCSSCTVRGNVQQTLDANGNVLTFTDELGHVTTYTYDSSGNVASQSAQLNPSTPVTTSYAYNSFGEPLTVTDPLGNVTTNAYDANGNLTSVTTPKPDSNTAASVTSFTYDSKGELTQITDPLNHVTKLAYTSVGLISTITDAQNHVTTYQYDNHGNRTAIIDALQNKTSFAYDAMDRLTTITYPDNTTASFAYDTRGRRTTVTDQNGKVTTYTYDDADRLTQVKDAASNVTQYAYDSESNLLSITDAAGHVTSFTYDAFGRVSRTSFPSTLTEAYTYDSVGNLTSKADRKGQSILYVYDALNRMTHKGYPDSTGVDYVYDLAGKIKQISDPTGVYGMAYDNMGRLIGTTTQYSFLPGSPAPTFTNSYAYDAASNKTQFTAPDGSTNTYQYDPLNRQTTLTNSLTGQFTFSYDVLNRRTGLNRPNALNTTYGYDSLSRLLSVLHQSGGTTADGASYTYDNAGNRTAKTNKLNNVAEQYTYDAIYQLQQVTQGTTTTESYTYDAVGNRLSSLSVPSYNYNSSNELTSTSAASFTYDNNGNTLSKTSSGAVTQYTWDFDNRLSSVVLPGTGGTANFKYDPFGRRIQKAFTQGSTTTTTNYIYDGSNSIEEVDQNGAVLARYTQAPGIDEPLAELRSGTTSYYQQDGLGSVTSLSNSTGSLANTYVYDSFGNITTSTGTAINPFQYTGRDFDPETGLRYYRARYYDPAVGRFLSEDPVGFDAGVNFYAYVGNSPTNWTDPDGLRKVKVCRQRLAFGHGIIGFEHHTYIRVFNDDGTETTYGILGNKGSRKNQIPRRNDPRNKGKECKDVTKCDEKKIDKLIDGLEQSVNSETCPSCGAAYRDFFFKGGWLDGYNSNTYVFNMISGAGMTPPSEGASPGYHTAPGNWYPQ
jgi:RHS repeat-associated protein